MYECEAKRKRRREDGGYEPFWKVKTVQAALDDNDSELRCKDCHGAVKLNRRKLSPGAGSYIEHLSRPDAEYCAAGLLFRQATDGREPRLSESPVS